MAAFGLLGVWAMAKGLSTELSPLDVVTGIGIILGTPFWWVLLRTTLRGPQALSEYGAYVEAHEGISFRSLFVLAMVATAVALTCGLISYVRTA